MRASTVGGRVDRPKMDPNWTQTEPKIVKLHSIPSAKRAAFLDGLLGACLVARGRLFSVERSWMGWWGHAKRIEFAMHL